MRVRTVSAISNAKGIIPIGQIIEIPDSLLDKLRHSVEPLHPPDEERQKGPHAWLVNGQLRTRGIFPGEWPDGGLASEIIKLTTNDLPLQAKLLQESVGAYLPGPHWEATKRKWKERVFVLIELEHMAQHEAILQSVKEMQLLAFINELKI